MILLDTSILIELFRKKDKSNTLFYQIAQEKSELAISSITHYEVGIGNNRLHQDYWESLCENLMVLPFDRICSETATSVYRELKSKNKLIDLADLLIGATSLSHEIPIATLNKKHFERIPGLKIY